MCHMQTISEPVSVSSDDIIWNIVYRVFNQYRVGLGNSWENQTQTYSGLGLSLTFGVTRLNPNMVVSLFKCISEKNIFFFFR